MDTEELKRRQENLRQNLQGIEANLATLGALRLKIMGALEFIEGALAPAPPVDTKEQDKDA